jgi:hypothetical protein
MDMENFAQKYHAFCSRFWPVIPLSYIVGSGISYAKFRLFHLIGILYFVDVLLHLKSYKIKKYEIPFILFFIWELLTIFWAASITLSLRYLFCLGNGYVLIFLVKNYVSGSREELQKFLRIIFVFNFGVMCLGVCETVGLFRWPYSLYSLTFHNSNLDELMKFYNTDSVGIAYLKSLPSVFFWNSNDLCFYLISTLPLLLITHFKEKWFKSIYLLLIFWILLANT